MKTVAKADDSSDALGRDNPSTGLTVRELEVRALVIQAYNAVLRRWPDPVGMRYYTDRLQSGAMSEIDVFTGLLRSEEAKLIVPAQTHGGDRPADRMAVLAGVFRAATNGELTRHYVDGIGRPHIDGLVSSALKTDFARSVLLFCSNKESTEGRVSR